MLKPQPEQNFDLYMDGDP